MIAIGIALILLTIGGAAAHLQSQRMAEKGTGAALSQAFGADVEVDDVRFDPMTSAIVVEGLRVMNPPAFEAGTAISCEEIIAEIDWRTVFTDTPRITRLALSGVSVNVEHGLGRGLNIGDWLTASENEEDETEGEETESESDAPKKGLLVDKIEIDGAKVEAMTSILPGRDIQMDVSRFDVNDVDGTQVQTPETLRAAILQGITKQAITTDMPAALGKMLEGFLNGDE